VDVSSYAEIDITAVQLEFRNILKDIVAFDYNTLIPEAETSIVERSLVEVDFKRTEGEKLSVTFIDVGQGLSIFINNGDCDVLIDAGDYKNVGNVLDTLESFETDDIELAIVTHRDADHVGGMKEVFDAYDVERVLDNGVPKDTKTNDIYLEAVKNEGLELVFDRDMVINLGDGVTLEIFDVLDDLDDPNESSIVSKLTYGESSILFTGDLGAEGERIAIRKGYDLQADILQAGHHGSRYSNSEIFLSVLTGVEDVVISAGENNTYGHPHDEAMNRFLNHVDGENIHSTIEDGNITFEFTENNYVKLGEEILPEIKVIEEKGNIVIESVDVRSEIVVIRNDGPTAVNLKGYTLVSVKGNQTYEFGEYSLEAGQTVSIASGKATGDIKWTGSYIWNNDGDPAQLRDPNSNVISSLH